MNMPGASHAVQGGGSYIGSFPRQYLYDEYSGSIGGPGAGNADGNNGTSGLMRTGLAGGGSSAVMLPGPDTDLMGDTGDLCSGADKPRILLMGLKRSGKTSIQKVVFHKMSPNETLFLESTNNIVKDDLSDMSFIRFKIWDIPGHVELFDGMFDYEALFQNTSAVIYVIDAQDDYTDALTKLHLTIARSYKVQPQLRYEVFIHKVDCLSDEQKIDIQRDITQRANDDLLDAGLESVSIGYHLTTIYDHSIFESFSKVVQKLLAHMAAFENLLNIFIQNSLLEKAFLFDVASKIYLATDCNIVDMQIYELCCDMIDVVVDIASIYNPRSELDSFFSERTSSTIRLNNDTVLYLRGVNKHLAMVCILREEALEKLGIIEYNFQCIKRGLLQILELKPCTPAVNGPPGMHGTSGGGVQLPVSRSVFDGSNEMMNGGMSHAT